ncbi:MAG: DUF4214 domain-containing protein [Betaproteobacteria bacterium]|nr:DUF4214 domain-containing protein [Betaproteobacteria bacterium]
MGLEGAEALVGVEMHGRIIRPPPAIRSPFSDMELPVFYRGWVRSIGILVALGGRAELVFFLFSTEFQTFTQALFGNAPVRKEVDTVMDLYRGLLARLPDNGGLSGLVWQFRTAQCQGAAAVYSLVEALSSGFAGSAEYAARNRTNAQYVGDLYNTFLRRGGDLAGVQFWINEIASGARSRDRVRQDFIATAEFTSRINAVIAEGCLPP